MALHGLYDFPLLTFHHAYELAGSGPAASNGSLPLGWLILLFLVVFFGGVGWTLRIVRRLRREQLKDTRQ